MKLFLKLSLSAALLVSLSSCRLYYMATMGDPVATKEKSKEIFSKVHGNTDDLYFYDQTSFEEAWEKKELTSIDFIGHYILTPDGKFLDTAGENCQYAKLNEGTPFAEMGTKELPKIRKQLSYYPEALKRIERFDGYTAIVMYSTALRKKGLKIAKETVESELDPSIKSQIIYLSADFIED